MDHDTPNFPTLGTKGWFYFYIPLYAPIYFYDGVIGKCPGILLLCFNHGHGSGWPQGYTTPAW